MTSVATSPSDTSAVAGSTRSLAEKAQLLIDALLKSGRGVGLAVVAPAGLLAGSPEFGERASDR